MKKLAKVLCVVLSVVLVGSVFAACGDKKNPDDVPKYDYKQGTFRTFTTVVPSTWNILDSIDQNNQQIMSYLSSGFYEYDYEFDEAQGGKYNKDGSINLNAIVDGKFEVKYSAATKLEDMTSEVDAKWGYTDAEKEAGAYAW